MNKQEAIEKIKNIETLHINDKIAGQQVDMVIKNQVLSLIEQIDEPKKVTIPKFVAEWLEYCKSNNLTLLGAFDPVSEHGIGLANTFTGEVRKGKDWAQRNQETFARAWLDGYKVEQEKLYTVEIAEAILTKITRGRNVQYKMLPSRDVSDVFNNAIYYITRLTEKEIKEAYERLWQFAKEVE